MAQLAFPCRIYSACDKATKVCVPRSHKEREINRGVINVGYLITCPCKLQYVGKTNRQPKIRMNEHKTAVKRGEPHSLFAMHFKEAKHKLSDLKFCGGGIEKKQINNWGVTQLPFDNGYCHWRSGHTDLMKFDYMVHSFPGSDLYSSLLSTWRWWQ